MKSIVSGLATEHSDKGLGPVILMLHGWGDSLHSFDILAEKLQGYQIVRLDLPGFGGSELPIGVWTVEDYARFIKEFCKKLHIEPQYMIGHSLGGRILIKAVASGLLNPRKLILVGSAGVADRQTVRNSAFMVLAKVGKLLLKPFPKSWYLRLRRELYRVTGGDYISTGALKETFLKVINEDLSETARQVSIPTLLIWGEDDIVTPVSEGKKLHSLIPNSELRVLIGAGHFVHQQKADDVAELIRKFFI
jgi:pimeloyl-ACP methyl ester carboxylesterase